MIDDDEDDFLLLQSAFRHQAPWVKLIWFDSPATFLDSMIWQRQPIHLFVFDLMIGDSVPHWQADLRQQVGYQAVPMVIYSGSESPGDQQLLLDDGAADFLLKGATTAETRQVVDRMLLHLD